MKHFLSLAGWSRDDLLALFEAADRFGREPVLQRDLCAALSRLGRSIFDLRYVVVAHCLDN